MELLKFTPEKGKSPRLRTFLLNKRAVAVYALLALFGFLGTSLAANINLNDLAPVEFGQGVAQTSSCTGSDSLIVTPFSSFDNSYEVFSLNEITISHIPDSCINKDFRISVYSNSALLNLDTDVSVARIPYLGSETTSVYKGTSGLETFGANIADVDASNGYGTFTLQLTGSKPAADLVERITIESALGTCKGVLESNPGESAYQIHQDCATLPDGLYWIQNANINGGDAFQIYADMTRNGGGWTLVVANGVSMWTPEEALLVNQNIPPLDPTILNDLGEKYSILSWADYIKRSASGFQYRIEASALGQWGGVFTANGAYSFVATTNESTDITRNETFDNWNYADGGLDARMPWYSPTGWGLLTTSEYSSDMWWGSLVAQNAHCGSAPAPYIDGSMACPNKIWYWAR